jgi:hypothetical protein
MFAKEFGKIKAHDICENPQETAKAITLKIKALAIDNFRHFRKRQGLGSKYGHLRKERT